MNATPAAPEFDLARWRDFPELLTDSWWDLGGRARGEGRSGAYHGNWVPQIPEQMMMRFTRPGERVLDMFAGSGTTLIEAVRLGRHSVGIELNPEVVAATVLHLDKLANPHGVECLVRWGDSSFPEIRSWLEPFQHVFLHPPYWDMISFSDSLYCLSSAESLKEFLSMFAGVIDNAYELLEPGRCMTLVVGDKYKNGEYTPLAFECMEVARRRGFELRAINPKKIQGNEKGKGKNANLWRQRAFRSGLYIFAHEYVMLFRRPRK